MQNSNYTAIKPFVASDHRRNGHTVNTVTHTSPATRDLSGRHQLSGSPLVTTVTRSNTITVMTTRYAAVK